MANTHKPYPCGVVLFPVIDACLELRAQNPGLARDAIASIKVEGHSLLRERADRPAVTTGREAQVSAQHSVAAVLIHGAAGVAQFEDACVNSPDVLALRKKVSVSDLPGTPVEAAHVTITLADGRTLSVLRRRRPRHAEAADVRRRHRGQGARAHPLRLSGPRSRPADRGGLVARPQRRCGRDHETCNRRRTSRDDAHRQMRADHRLDRGPRLRHRGGACGIRLQHRAQRHRPGRRRRRRREARWRRRPASMRSTSGPTSPISPQIERLVATAAARFGSIDIVVNNAVVRHFAPIEKLTPAEWEQSLAVNLSAPFHLARLTLPMMRAKRLGPDLQSLVLLWLSRRGESHRLCDDQDRADRHDARDRARSRRHGHHLQRHLPRHPCRRPTSWAASASSPPRKASARKRRPRQYLAGRRPAGRFVRAGERRRA